MQMSQLIVTILITTVIVAAVIFATAASLFPRSVEAHSYSSWNGLPRRHGERDPCSRLDLPVGKLAGVMIENHLQLTASQRKLLEPMLAALETWRSHAKVHCSALAHGDIPDRLKAMETMLRLSADRIAELQPGWDVFHASLDETQRAHIADAMQREQRHRAHR